MLLLRAEPPNLIHDAFYDIAARQASMTPQGFDQALFSEFLAGVVKRFGYAIRVERQGVSGGQRSLAHTAVPISEHPQDCGRRLEPFERVVAPQEKRWKVTAIRKSQAASLVVVFGKEQRRVGRVRRILMENVVHGSQQMLRAVQGPRALDPQIRLKIRHQERRGNALAGDVADHQPETLSAQVQEIVVIAPTLAGLDACTRIFERSNQGWMLREEPGLNLFSDFELLRGAAFRFQLLGNGAPLRLDLAGHFVEPGQRERVSIRVFEVSEYSAPNPSLTFPAREWPWSRGCAAAFEVHTSQAWSIHKLHAALTPFRIFP